MSLSMIGLKRHRATDAPTNLPVLSLDDLERAAFNAFQLGQAGHIEPGPAGSSHEGWHVLYINRRAVAQAPHSREDNPLASGTFCDRCGTRLDDRGGAVHPCPICTGAAA